jgi:hypothetical protein
MEGLLHSPRLREIRAREILSCIDDIQITPLHRLVLLYNGLGSDQDLTQIHRLPHLHVQRAPELVQLRSALLPWSAPTQLTCLGTWCTSSPSASILVPGCAANGI